jgi:hypothetical protein
MFTIGTCCLSAKSWLQAFPPMQAPANYNLTRVMEQIKSGKGHPSD